jgi:hypothetical protein
MRLLLTGAGFSRNWGGWLAEDVFEYLLGDTDLDVELRRMLWADRRKGYGFEDTLGELQRLVREHGRSEDSRRLDALDALTTSLAGMLNLMNQGLAAARFEPSNDVNRSIAAFLRQFDALFTLNQDLLLEHHYNNDPAAFHASGRAGWQVAGVRRLGPDVGFDPTPPMARMQTPSADSFDAAHGFQPCFKLHGSSNFVRDPGGRILVMGGNKVDTIQDEPLLRWCRGQFVDYLSRADRLMVMGYSFGDRHINDAIAAAVGGGRLKLFIVDPRGVDVLEPRQQGAINPAAPLTESLGPHVLGASRRPLRETFGDDLGEYGKLQRFMAA